MCTLDIRLLRRCVLPKKGVMDVMPSLRRTIKIDCHGFKNIIGQFFMTYITCNNNNVTNDSCNVKCQPLPEQEPKP